MERDNQAWKAGQTSTNGVENPDMGSPDMDIQNKGRKGVRHEK